MAEPLLDQIRAQIRARVHELEPLAREYERLAAAFGGCPARRGTS